MLATLMYGLARRLNLMALVDLIWTGGLGLAGVAYVSLQGEFSLRAGCVLLILGLWSLRLTTHLLRDRVMAGYEDPRYLNLAKHWGARAPRNFYFLFLAQVVFVALFLIPVLVAVENPAPSWQIADGIAVLVALVALVGEAVADRQLARFRADSQRAGEICQSGLWRYSRHPNYFFEWLHWWAYVAFAWGASNWWLSLVGPCAMYLFLRYLTGIPHAERSSLKRRGEAYRVYQQTTNTFFPWIPRPPLS